MTKEELRKITGGTGHIASKQDQDRIIGKFRAAGYDMCDLYQELEMSSYYVDTHQDTSFGGAVVHMHSHGFYECICVQSACGVEYMIDSQCVQIQPGDILLLSPGVPHRPLMPEQMPVPYVRDVLWLSVEFAEAMSRQIGLIPQSGKGFVCRTAGTQWAHLPELFRNGVRETEAARPNWELAVLGNTLILMAELRRFFSDAAPLPRKDKAAHPLERALAYIDDHYRERTTLADIANYCFVSESTICHIFREKMGISFHRCLTQRRLIASKELICTGASLEDVSKAVGFADYAAFYRAFKREYGLSPRQFKALSLGNLLEERK